MSNVDVYCILHYDEKQVFAYMGELGLTLDLKDFATNMYQVDKREHPSTMSIASGRKGKAVIPSEDEEVDEEKKKDHVGAGTSQGAKDDNVVNLSNDKEYIPAGGDEPLLIGAQLTFVVVDVEALVRRRNVIAPRTLFVEEPVV